MSNEHKLVIGLSSSSGVATSTWAAKPSPGSAGALWVQTDGPYIAYDTGSDWLYKAYGFPVTPPDFTGFSWLNQGSGTLSTTNGAGTFYLPGVVGINLTGQVRSIVDADLTFTVLRTSSDSSQDYSIHGLLFRNSSNGRMVVMGAGQNDRLAVLKYSNYNAFDGAYVTTWQQGGAGWGSGPRWERLVRSGSTRYFQVSVDGYNWETLTSHAWTDYLTPNQVGVFSNSQNAGLNYRMTVLSMNLSQ